MIHSLSESNWNPPPVDSIVCNIDRIYAAGLFWRVVSPQLLERQSRLMSAIASMTEKLRASLPPDQPLQERRQRRLFPTSSSLRTKHDSLTTRHRRELRLYAEAIKRAEKKSMLDLDPTAANITLVYNQLTASLEFWEDAKFWYGMPWWRKPRLDFPWAPPLSETTDHDSPGRPASSTMNDSHRLVTFREGVKDSSPKAPAITRVPRCSITANPELSVHHAFRPGVRLVTV